MSGSIISFTGQHDFLSNFYPSPIHYGFDDLTYPTVENFFQAMKIDVGETHKRAPFVRDTPSEAKRRGRRVQLREHWETMKLDVMEYGVGLKFAANTELAQRLLDTGDVWLEEGNTWNDTYWGTVNRIGSNWLGLILMRQRERLRAGVADGRW